MSPLSLPPILDDFPPARISVVISCLLISIVIFYHLYECLIMVIYSSSYDK